MTASAPPLPWRWLGRVRYGAAVEEMEAARARVHERGAPAEVFLLAEHEPVITLGRAASAEHVVVDAAGLAGAGVEVVRSSRGGDVTYHGPGQLMVYPIVRLDRGVVEHLARIAGALAEVVAELGVAGAAWRRDPAGLWLGEHKLAACGLHVQRGVAIHGFALDLDTPAAAWQRVVPCGLSSSTPRSVAAVGGRAASAALLAPRVAARVAAALGRSAVAG